jgi:hypothetical protein
VAKAVPKSTSVASARLTLSPCEFASLFGRSQTWGYRQIYAGKVKTITEYGRILIPAAEVDRILASAGIYQGLKIKHRHSLEPEPKKAWREFIRKKKAGERPIHSPGRHSPGSAVFNPAARSSALARLSASGSSARAYPG